ncbi:MAG: hypothetical protein B7Y80_01595 [Hyphomicrobium sp. 32-62-53]|nr:MAG: hypothetical protein B7Z29_01945 [Hyphomicrobium sp. 12-62-95]OYY01448.1 MAG: hypothetical protein B7Y80_01595 [Hyphomicrobium sp. 32-62-53]
MSYTIPPHFTAPAEPFEAAGQLAGFLLENAGSVGGTWRGTMRAADQRRLFGRFLGKGRLVICGRREIVTHGVTTAFGMDFDETFRRAWRDL